MLRKKLLVVLVATALATLAAACRKLPTAPSEPPGPKDGAITITYQPPATCLCAGTGHDGFCDRRIYPVRVQSVDWPTGYVIGNPWADMVANGDGTFTFSGTAPIYPPPARLKIRISDCWTLPSNGGDCFTGRGITINGVKLEDGEKETSFSFVPPTVIR